MAELIWLGGLLIGLALGVPVGYFLGRDETIRVMLRVLLFDPADDRES
jgi:ABC-type nitrate/sulfonate/bicarbonate transport system permease component